MPLECLFVNKLLTVEFIFVQAVILFSFQQIYIDFKFIWQVSHILKKCYSPRLYPSWFNRQIVGFLEAHGKLRQILALSRKVQVWNNFGKIKQNTIVTAEFVPLFQGDPAWHSEKKAQNDDKTTMLYRPLPQACRVIFRKSFSLSV